MGKIILLIFPPINIKQYIILIKIILEYSLKKIKANQPPLYSTLKPDTNSDSPSEKSNGERLVSAIAEDNQHKLIGIIIKINQIFF